MKKAFTKAKVLPSGVTANHWEVLISDADFIGKRVTIVMVGYTSRADFLAGKSPLPESITRVTLQGNQDGSFPFLDTDLGNVVAKYKERCIEAALADPAFTGAVVIDE